MPKVIAMAGKGGTGKTTLSALLLRYLVKNNKTPVLAVDADSNANLNELLGPGNRPHHRRDQERDQERSAAQHEPRPVHGNEGASGPDRGKGL